MMWLAINQYGEKVCLRGLHPRALLLDHLGRKSAQKIYRDVKGGGSVHVGWIVAGAWWSVYKLTPYGDAAPVAPGGGA